MEPDIDARSIVEYFKLMFDQEADRSKDITDRGKLYVSIISIMIGLTTYKNVEFLGLHGAQIQIGDLIISVITLAIFLISFVCCIGALSIRKYEALNDPAKLLEKIVADNWDIGRFRERCLADYTVSTNRNNIVNDRRAKWLRTSVFFMCAGFLSELVLFLFVVNRYFAGAH